MKQTTKMFTGCPYEQYSLTCEACPNYKKCLAEKQRRAKAFNRRFYIKMSIVLTIVFCVMVVINQVTLNHEAKAAAETSSTTVEETTAIQIETKESVETVEKTVKKAKLSAYEPSEEYFYSLSEEDKVLIAKVVWAESRGECFEGKVAVAAVILNRYFNGEGQAFNRSSIEAVVTQKSQFASISKVTIEDLEANPECMEAVEAACKGWDPTRQLFEEGACFFYAPKGVTGYQAEIREGIKVLVIGNHNFHVDFEKVN